MWMNRQICRKTIPGLLLVLLAAANFCNADNQKLVEVVGVGECADCHQNNIKNSHAFRDLKVTIDCKLANGGLKTRGEGKLDEEGKFQVSFPQDLVENGKLKEECYAQLHSASNTPCPTFNGIEATKLAFVSESNGKHTFSPVAKLKFSPFTCTSAFLWPFFKYPHKPSLPKLSDYHWPKKSFPKLSFPPIKWPHKFFHKKPFPHVPIYKKPFPSVPIYKKPFPPVPIYKKPFPPVPIYKKPLPPPVPIYKKPFPPVPIYKKPFPPVPIYKKPLPPVPIYKKPLPPPVPIYKKPCPPIFKKPPIPVYKPKPLPPLFPKKPCPPITIPKLPPLPKFPPHKFFEHPKFKKWPSLPLIPPHS